MLLSWYVKYLLMQSLSLKNKNTWTFMSPSRCVYTNTLYFSFFYKLYPVIMRGTCNSNWRQRLMTNPYVHAWISLSENEERIWKVFYFLLLNWFVLNTPNLKKVSPGYHQELFLCTLFLFLQGLLNIYTPIAAHIQKLDGVTV